MSKIFVDQVDPKTATTLTLGTSGDTVSIPSGVTLSTGSAIATASLGSGTASSSTFLRGDSTWAAPTDTGNYIKIANTNGTGSVSEAYINDCFSETYRTYLITFQIEASGDGSQIRFRFRKDDDSSFDSGYQYAIASRNHSGTNSGYQSNSDTSLQLSGGTMGGASSTFGVVNGFMYIHNPYTIASGEAGAGAIHQCFFNGQWCEVDDSGGYVTFAGGGRLGQNANNVAGIEFYGSSLNITDRNITVWGLKEY